MARTPIKSIVDEPMEFRNFRELDAFLLAKLGPVKKETRPCPDCGDDLPPRRQLCPACAKKRKLASNRKAARKWRARVRKVAFSGLV